MTEHLPNGVSRLDLADSMLNIAARFHSLTRMALIKKDLTIRQLDALEVVSSNPGISLGGLALKLGLANSTVSELVDRLVKIDYLQRTDNPENRREIRVELADAGVRYVEQRKKNIKKAIAQMLNNLPLEQQTELERALNTIMSILSGRRGNG